MSDFKIVSNYKTTFDQENAINKLVNNLNNNINYQVLLGVTGSGKTFTMANVIQRLQKPALIISHNKTLAAQLYQEFRDFFPENAVSYFVSYYDYYQPEAYIPSTDTYIEKDVDINELIDKLRLAATTNLLTRKDTIVVASVSCIYNIGSPKEYGNFVLELEVGKDLSREKIIERLIDLQYERGDFGFHRGTFRVIGNTLDIYPAYQDEGIRIEMEGGRIKLLSFINPITGSINRSSNPNSFLLYPAKHYITDPKKNAHLFDKIRVDLAAQVNHLKSVGRELEAHRIEQRVNYDLKMIEEVGYVKGIENYSRYFDGRKPGDPPFTLIDYFNHPYKDDWLLFVDESHMTFPQIRGMYAGDMSRKQTLIDYGFRLPAAIDNRPLKFEEFLRRIPNFIATSATPSDWELSYSYESFRSSKLFMKTKNTHNKKIALVEQLLRPTGIPDPLVSIRPIKNQVEDVISEIKLTAKKGQRTLVTTLTKQTAEDLAEYLDGHGIKVHYLHSDIKTLERTDILDSLRKGDYECIIGVNLLREGLDLPEVSLVAILDGDKEGFLRSEVSLVQTMGRAARHVEGRVVLYADKITNSIKNALTEIKRRRQYQLKMNKIYNITPFSIDKPIRDKLIEFEEVGEIEKIFNYRYSKDKSINEIDVKSLTPLDKRKLEKILRREMKIAAQDLNFELAIELRDKIKEIN